MLTAFWRGILNPHFDINPFLAARQGGCYARSAARLSWGGRALSRPARCSKVYLQFFHLIHTEAYTIIYSSHDVEKKKPS